MSGRAIILVVVWIIVIAGTILYRIEAASTALVSASAGYQKKQTAKNIAQSGVNLSLRQLQNARTWRTGFSPFGMLSGTVSVSVFDTTYAGITNAIGIRSKGVAQESSATTTAFCYFPKVFIPSIDKGLLTLHATNSTINGNITIDARDHDPFSTVVNPGQGTYAVWSTGTSFNFSGSSQGGGTGAGVDYAPTNPPNPAVVLINQTYPGGFPNTPDSAFGGASNGYPEGALKAVAMSGVAGSQYVTDPSRLTYPLRGVTYVEAAGTWNSANIAGSGILIVHNSSKTAVLKDVNGDFAGVLIADDITHLHNNFWGAIVGLTTTPSGNVLGNGNASIYYSRTAINNAMGIFTNGVSLKVIAWWE